MPQPVLDQLLAGATGSLDMEQGAVTERGRIDEHPVAHPQVDVSAIRTRCPVEKSLAHDAFAGPAACPDQLPR